MMKLVNCYMLDHSLLEAGCHLLYYMTMMYICSPAILAETRNGIMFGN